VRLQSSVSALCPLLAMATKKSKSCAQMRRDHMLPLRLRLRLPPRLPQPPPLLPPLLLLTLALLAPRAHAPSAVCEDRLGAECVAFSAMGECGGRRREWMRENCALSCDVCRPPRPAPASAGGGPRRTQRPPPPRPVEDDGDSWRMHVVELADAQMLARFHRSNKRSMVRAAAPPAPLPCLCELPALAPHAHTSIGSRSASRAVRTGTVPRSLGQRAADA
jgi:hypothetical protein